MGGSTGRGGSSKFLLFEAVDAARQILGHLAVVDGVDTGLLHRLAPPGSVTTTQHTVIDDVISENIRPYNDAAVQ